MGLIGLQAAPAMSLPRDGGADNSQFAAGRLDLAPHSFRALGHTSQGRRRL